MSTETSTFITQLEEKTREELLSLAQREGLENGTTLTSFSRSELLQLVLRNHSDQQGALIARGILEIMSDGYGFLRQYGLKPQGHRDVYVSQSQIRSLVFGRETWLPGKFDLQRIQNVTSA